MEIPQKFIKDTEDDKKVFYDFNSDKDNYSIIKDLPYLKLLPKIKTLSEEVDEYSKDFNKISGNPEKIKEILKLNNFVKIHWKITSYVEK